MDNKIQFTDSANDDYTLQSGSPGIDAGNSNFATTYDLNERFLDYENFIDGTNIFLQEDDSVDAWVNRINKIYNDYDLLDKISKISRPKNE